MRAPLLDVDAMRTSHGSAARRQCHLSSKMGFPMTDEVLYPCHRKRTPPNYSAAHIPDFFGDLR